MLAIIKLSFKCKGHRSHIDSRIGTRRAFFPLARGRSYGATPPPNLLDSATLDIFIGFVSFSFLFWSSYIGEMQCTRLSHNEPDNKLDLYASSIIRLWLNLIAVHIQDKLSNMNSLSVSPWDLTKRCKNIGPLRPTLSQEKGEALIFSDGS